MIIRTSPADSVLFEQYDKSLSLNSTLYVMLYPQNDDIMTIDSVTSLHPLSKILVMIIIIIVNCLHWYVGICLQCFDAVGWAAGRACGL